MCVKLFMSHLVQAKRSEDFQPTIAELTNIVGSENIFYEGAEYTDMCKDPAVHSQSPQAFVFPENLKMLKDVVQVANKYKCPIWTYSTGKNWGYSNTTKDSNSIVVVLSKMNQIIHVDEKMAYALIEPGVTYKQLRNYLDENNIALWTDSPGGPPTGSVLGNALDRGCGVTRYCDHYSHLSGMEVLLADGTLLNTGAVSPSKTKTSHLYRWGVGPQIDGLFAQSNLGIVTKAAIQLMPKPKDYGILSAQIASDEDLSHCIDEARQAMLSGEFPPTGRFSNDVALLTLITQAIDEPNVKNRALSAEDLQFLKAKYEVPTWQGSMATYGPTDVINPQLKVLSRRLRKHSSVKILKNEKIKFLIRAIKTMDQFRNGWVKKLFSLYLGFRYSTSIEMARLFEGLRNLHEGTPVETVVRRGYFRHHTKRPSEDIHVAKDGVGVLWTVPVLPFEGASLHAYIQMARKSFAKYDFDFYMTIMIFNERSVCPLMVILYDRSDQNECERAEKLYKELVNEAHQEGYQQFRAGYMGWEMLYHHNPELKDFLHRLKATLDPDGIFAPGKYGIN